MYNETIRVLIADDSPSIRAHYTHLLSETCEVVAAVEDGRRAVAAAAELRPDVVVMDVHMPEMDGIEATRRISRDHPETAVVLVSVDTDMAFIRRAMAAGARDYLGKPARPAEVRRVVTDTARLVREQRRVMTGQGPGRPGTGTWSFLTPEVGGAQVPCLGMASELACMGARVAVVDLEPYFATLGFALGLPASGRNLYNLQRIHSQGGAFTPADYFRAHDAGFRYLGPPLGVLEASQLDAEAMTRVVAAAERDFDYVLVVLPAGVPEDYFRVVDRSRHVFLTGAASPMGIKNLAVLRTLMEKLGYFPPQLRTVLTEVEHELDGVLKAAGLSPDLALPRDDSAVEEAFRTGRPVTRCAPRSPLARRLRRYMIRALELPGEVDETRPPRGLFQRFVALGGALQARAASR